MSARPEIRVEPLTQHEQFRDAVRLQKEIWGFDDLELLPLRLFVTASKVGGQTFGAFDGKRMIGFALAIPGIHRGVGPYLHSHMVGVLPGYRNFGVGRAIKVAQRQEALARKIELMEWTFDPLELKNAHFNIERLGAVIRRYVLNQYGHTTSALHAGLPTDRCVAEWWLSSDRVARAVSNQPFERSRVEREIDLPGEIGQLKLEQPERAAEIQARVSGNFLDAFSQGLAVTGFRRTANTAHYQLSRWS